MEQVNHINKKGIRFLLILLLVLTLILFSCRKKNVEENMFIEAIIVGEAYFPLNETSGTNALNWEGNPNATLAGAVFEEGTEGIWRARLDGINDYILSTDDGSYDVAENGDLSFCADIMITNCDGQLFDTAAGASTKVHITAACKAIITIMGTGAPDTTNHTFINNTEEHICFVFDNSEDSIDYYVNGSWYWSGVETANSAIDVDRFNLGSADQNPPWLNGTLREVRWYNSHALSAAEVSEIYEGIGGVTNTVPTTPTNLTINSGIFDWNTTITSNPLINCSGSTDADSDVITYVVEKGNNSDSTSGLVWTILGNHTDNTVYTWDISGETDGEVYEEIRGRAIDTNGTNTYSDYYTIYTNLTIGVSTPGTCSQPPTPTTLANTSQNNESIYVEWGESLGVENYLIYSSSVNLWNVSGLTVYNITGLSAETTYALNITSYNSSCTTPESNFSNTIEVTTPASPVSGGTPSANTNIMVNLTFDDATDPWRDYSEINHSFNAVGGANYVNRTYCKWYGCVNLSTTDGSDYLNTTTNFGFNGDEACVMWWLYENTGPSGSSSRYYYAIDVVNEDEWFATQEGDYSITGEWIAETGNVGGNIGDTKSTPAQTWTHYAQSYDGLTYKAWINGVLEKNVSAAKGNLNMTSTGLPFVIGVGPYGINSHGFMDEIIFKNVSCNTAEVLVEYDLKKAGTPPDIDLYIKNVTFELPYDWTHDNNSIEVNAGNIMEINITIRNEGVTDNAGAFDWNVSLGDTNICSGVLSLNTETEQIVICNWTSSIGFHTGSIFIDKTNAITEDSEINNNISLYIPFVDRPYMHFNITEYNEILRPYFEDSANLVPYNSNTWVSTFAADDFNEDWTGDSVDPRGKTTRFNAMACFTNEFVDPVDKPMCVRAMNHLYGWGNRTVSSYSSVQAIHELFHVGFAYDLMFANMTEVDHDLLSREFHAICQRLNVLVGPENDDEGGIYGDNGFGFGSGMAGFCYALIGDYKYNPTLIIEHEDQYWGESTIDEWMDRERSYLQSYKNDSWANYQEGWLYKTYSQPHLVENLFFEKRWGLNRVDEYNNAFCAMGREALTQILDNNYNGVTLRNDENNIYRAIQRGDTNSYQDISDGNMLGWDLLLFYGALCDDVTVKQNILWFREDLYNNTQGWYSYPAIYIYKQVEVDAGGTIKPEETIDKIIFDNANDIFTIRTNFTYTNDTVIQIDGGEERGTGHSQAQGYFLYVYGEPFYDQEQVPYEDDVRAETWKNGITLQNDTQTSEGIDGTYSATCGNAELNQYYGMQDCTTKYETDYPSYRVFPKIYGGDLYNYVGSDDANFAGIYVERPYFNATLPVREYFVKYGDTLIRRVIANSSEDTGIFDNYINIYNETTEVKDGLDISLNRTNNATKQEVFVKREVVSTSQDDLVVGGGLTNVKYCFGKTSCGSPLGYYRKTYYHTDQNTIDLTVATHWNIGSNGSIEHINTTLISGVNQSGNVIVFDKDNNNHISNNDIKNNGWGLVYNLADKEYGGFNYTSLNLSSYELISSDKTLSGICKLTLENIICDFNSFKDDDNDGYDYSSSIIVTLDAQYLTNDSDFQVLKNNAGSDIKSSESGTTLIFTVDTDQNGDSYYITGGIPGPEENQTATPTGFICPNIGNSSIYCSWTAQDASKYLMFRNGTNIANTTDIFYNSTGLTPSTAYSHYMKAFNDTYTLEESNASTILYNSTDASPASIPDNQTATPTGLICPNIDNSSIYCSWTDQSTDKYLFYRNGTNVANTTGLFYNSTSLTANTPYSHYIKAYDTNYTISESNASTIIYNSTLVSVPDNQTATPTGLICPSIDNSSIYCSWTAQGASKYLMFRNDTNIVNTTDIYYNNTGLTPTTYYSHYIKAFNDTYTIEESNASSIIYNITESSPEINQTTTPTNFICPYIGNSSIYCNWTDQSADKYLIYRNATNIANTTDIYYNDTSLTSETAYSHYIKAYDVDYTIPESNASTILYNITSESPEINQTATPTGFECPSLNSDSIYCNWTQSADKYLVYRNSTNIANTTNSYYNDTSLTSGITYSHYIKAYDTNYTIPESNISISISNLTSRITLTTYRLVNDSNYSTGQRYVATGGGTWLETTYSGSNDDIISSSSLFEMDIWFDVVEEYYWTYQETANSYNYSSDISQTNYFYANYTKPPNVLPASLWQVKHGVNATYNITIPTNCWNEDPLQFRIWSLSDSPFSSRPQCYGGGTWNTIGTLSSSTGVGTSLGEAPTTKANDGNWSTYNAWVGATIYIWIDTYLLQGQAGNKIFEEAMWFAKQFKIEVEGSENNTNVELLSTIKIESIHLNESTIICIDSSDKYYGTNGINVSCGLSNTSIDLTLDYVSINEFNDSASSKNLSTNITGYLPIKQYWEIKELTSSIKGIAYGSVYPTNLSIDLCNDSTKEIVFPGKFVDDELRQLTFSNSITDNITFNENEQVQLMYLEIPSIIYGGFTLDFEFIPSIYLFTYFENFTTTEFQDTDETDAEWNTTSNTAHMELNLYKGYLTGGQDSDLSECQKTLSLSFSNLTHAYDNSESTFLRTYTYEERADDHLYKYCRCQYFYSYNLTYNTDITLKYYLYVAKTGGTSDTSGSTVLNIYNFNTSAWVGIDGVSITGTGDKSLETADPKTTVWDFTDMYVNITGDNRTDWRICHIQSIRGGDYYVTNIGRFYDGAQGIESSDGYLTGTTDSQKIQTISLYAPITNLTSIDFNSSITEVAQSNVTIYLTADGTNWEEVLLENENHTFNFTNQGKDLRLKAEFSTNNESKTAILNSYIFPDEIGVNYPENLTIDVAADGVFDYENNTIINESFSLNLSSTSSYIETYITSECDGLETCLFPISFYSDTRGILSTSPNLTSKNVKSMNISSSCMSDYCNTTDCNIPIVVDDSYLELTDLMIPYKGHKNITFTARYSNNSFNQSINISVYYSNWSSKFPNYISYLEFFPTYVTSKNVQPFGQSASKPIMNITTLNYDKNMNWSIYLNNSNSCINLTVSKTSTKSSGTVLQNKTWYDFINNQSINVSQGLWMWEDFNCDYTLRYWSPELYYKGCCIGCACSDEVLD